MYLGLTERKHVSTAGTVFKVSDDARSQNARPGKGIYTHAKAPDYKNAKLKI